jgi:hypothetical protein
MVNTNMNRNWDISFLKELINSEFTAFPVALCLIPAQSEQSMRKAPLFIKALVFILIAFGPSLPVIRPFLLLLSFPGPERELVLMRFAITLLPLGSAIVAYWRCTKVSSWRARGWIIFLYWQFLLLPISFLAASTLVGISMAVADGILSGMDEFWAILQMVPLCQGMMQALVITWTLISTFLLRLIFKSSLNVETQS